MQSLCTKVSSFSSIRNTSKQSLTQIYKTPPHETLLYNPDMPICSPSLPSVIFHGAARPVPMPKLSPTAYSRDFGSGFYCTANQDEARRTALIFADAGCINSYRLTSINGLRLLVFSEINTEWLDFVSRCYNGVRHDYDLVCGPMVDDSLWSFVYGYLAGDIPQSVFLEFARFRHPTHQVSFHTPKALACLTFLRCEAVS